jgi:hypothetical protein
MTRFFVRMNEMALISKTSLLRLRFPMLALALAVLTPAPTRADGFDDMRRTFETDIPHFFQTDVPHFFQDDIPCAFGGKPTSGTKTSCKSSPPQKAKPVNSTSAPPDSSDATRAPKTNAPSDIEEKLIPAPAPAPDSH